MKGLIRIAAFTGLAAATSALAGQWNGGGYIGTVNFDTDEARRQGVEDSAESIGGYAEYQTDALIALSMGGQFLFYDDNEEFSEYVEYEYLWGGDDYGWESSEAYAMHLFVDAGPRWRFGEGYAGIAAGLTNTIYSERAISNCNNCPSEDIELDGGGYGKVAAGFKAGAVNIGLMARTFFGGDIDNEVYLTVGTAFD